MGLATQRPSICMPVHHAWLKTRWIGRRHYVARRGRMITSWTSYLRTLVLDILLGGRCTFWPIKTSSCQFLMAFKLLCVFLAVQATPVRLTSCTQAIHKCVVGYLTSLRFGMLGLTWAFQRCIWLKLKGVKISSSICYYVKRSSEQTCRRYVHHFIIIKNRDQNNYYVSYMNKCDIELLQSCLIIRTSS